MASENIGREIILRANLSSNSKSVTPQLKGWRLGIAVNAVGEGHVVQLIEDPSNLSTLANANYGTLLRWKPSLAAGGAAVTYNVYRSESPYFTLNEDTFVTNVSEPTFTDMNLKYGEIFFYQVTAVAEINGIKRESLPSNQAWAKVVDEDEVQKNLGLQDYWSYAGFSTGSGDGYVNVNNGNMVYITTDMVISDPFFASVMRRTYNSMATTKTPMGYGWDFSFNTTLMREFDGDAETGMLLKDGDGSFHSFPLNSEGGYDPAKGTFMKLEKVTDEQSGAILEYTITRKDNVKYHFDAGSLRLLKFSNPLGKELTFTYDMRGNVTEITNTVEDKIYIEYYISNSNPQGDDSYVNEHVDMVKSVRWVGESEVGDPVTLEYNYLYGDDDKLDKAVILNELLQEYKEEFAYLESVETSSTDEPLWQMTITNSLGQPLRVIHNANGQVQEVHTPMAGEYSTFSYDNEGENVQTVVANQYGVGTTYVTDANGCLTQKTDALGHPVNYTYNPALQITGLSYENEVEGVLQTIENTYEYDANGNITKVAGPMGSTTEYLNYNIFNKPQSMRVKKSSGDSWLTTNYEYDDFGNLTKTTSAVGTTEQRITTNTYGTQTHNKGYLLSQTDEFVDKTTNYTYDRKGRVEDVWEVGTGNLSRHLVHYTYDEYGRTKTQTDAMGRETTLSYNKFGLLEATEYPNGAIERVEYDLMGKVVKTTDANLEQTKYRYDGLNRLVEVEYADGTKTMTAYEHWDSDRASESDGELNADKVITTDAEGRSSTTYYDKAGRVHKEVGGGVAVEYEYDQIGNVVKQTQIGNNDGGLASYARTGNRIVTASYNALGQVTSQTMQAGQNPSADDITTRFTYDLLGNQLTVTDALNQTTSYAYDNLNRLTSVTQNLGGTPLTTSYSYDNKENGLIRNSVTDANGNRDDSWFNALGDKVEDSTPGMRTLYTYNNDGTVKLVTRNDDTKVLYTYDNMGRPKRTFYYETGAMPTDNLGAGIDPNAKQYVEVGYDNVGNITMEKVAEQKEPLNWVEERTTYAYDGMGRMRQYVQGEGSTGLTIHYEYNNAGQIAQTRYFKNDNQTGGTGADPRYQVTTYTYDAVTGQNTAIYAGTMDTQPQPQVLSNNLVRSYEFNALGEVVKTIDYPNLDRETSRVSNTDTNITTTNYTYDNFGRMTQKVYKDHSSIAVENGVIKESHALSYDKNGNIVREEMVNNYDQSLTTIKNYTYDDVGRLTKVLEEERKASGTKTDETEYGYDAVGNRIRMKAPKKDSGGNTIRPQEFSYEYNTMDQLIKITSEGRDVSTYEYDARGNQKQDITGEEYGGSEGTIRFDDRVTAHEYDLMNQLTTSTITRPELDNNGAVVQGEFIVEVTKNAYSAAGKRIKRTETIKGVEETSRFYYMGDALLYTSDEHQVLLTENILDLAGTTIMSKRFMWAYQEQNGGDGEDYTQYNNKWFTYRYDARGSVTSITSTTGELMKGHKYTEFGQVKDSGIEKIENEQTYTGSIKDTSTGLQYMNARFYEPETGRFLSQDSYTGNAYDPWTQHLYAYCANNPVNFIDPTGHSAIKPKTAAEALGISDYAYARLSQEANLLGLFAYEMTADHKGMVSKDAGNIINHIEKNKEQKNPVKRNNASTLMTTDDEAYWYGLNYANTDPERFQLFLDDLYGRYYTDLMTYGGNEAYKPSAEEEALVLSYWDKIFYGMLFIAGGGISVGSSSSSEKVSADDIQFSDKFNDPKYANQPAQRGWNNHQIADAINNPVKTTSGINKANGNPTTNYFIDKTQYVTVDNGTGKVIQVSDKSIINWKPNTPR